MISQDPGTQTYGIKVGDLTGDGWTVVTSGLTFVPWQDITIHYKAATQTMDAYLGDTKVASDFTTGHGRYDVSFIQIEWTRGGADSWRQFKLGMGPNLIPTCGDQDHPYPVGDLSKDCRVNLEDFAKLASTWLECTAPECVE